MTKVEIEKVIFNNAKTVKDLQKRVETLEQNHKMDDRQLKVLAIVLLSYSENVGDVPESLTKTPLFDSILNLKPCCELCAEFDDNLCHGFTYKIGDEGIPVKPGHVCLAFRNFAIQKIVDKLNEAIE